MNLYSEIKLMAKKKKIPISKIEKDLCMSNGSISKWNTSIPRSDLLQKVADYLGVTSTYLLDRGRDKRKGE